MSNDIQPHCSQQAFHMYFYRTVFFKYCYIFQSLTALTETYTVMCVCACVKLSSSSASNKQMLVWLMLYLKMLKYMHIQEKLNKCSISIHLVTQDVHAWKLHEVSCAFALFVLLDP